MERLTERFDDGEVFCGKIGAVEDVGVDETIFVGELVDKLAEYEQAEEDGLLIRLPHPVGTDVYFAFKLQGVKKDQIRRWQYNKNGLMFYSHGCAYSVDAIGKTIFLTKAEAEQALAKMKGE